MIYFFSPKHSIHVLLVWPLCTILEPVQSKVKKFAHPCSRATCSGTHCNPSTSSECNAPLFMFQSPRIRPPSAASGLTHLAVEQRVVVPPHLRVDVVEVPLKAFTLQTLPQRDPLRDVSVIDTVVLQGQSHSLGGGSLCFARGQHGRLMVTMRNSLFICHQKEPFVLCAVKLKHYF